MGAKIRTEPQGLTEIQVLAAGLVASGLRGSAIAKRLNVTASQLSRWRQLPAFRAEVNKLLNEVSQGAKERLISLSSVAIDVLAYSLVDKESSSSDRLKAAIAILGLVGCGDKAAPLVRLGDRLPESEEAIAQSDAVAERGKLERDYFDSFEFWQEADLVDTEGRSPIDTELGRIADLYQNANNSYLQEANL